MFQIGTHVNFIGFTAKDGKIYANADTYIWAFLDFGPPVGIKYIVEHPQGFPKEQFFDERFEPATNKYLDKYLQDGKLYLFALSTDMEEILPNDVPIETKKEEVTPAVTPAESVIASDLSSVALAKEEVKQSLEQKQETVPEYSITLGEEKFILPEKVFHHLASIEKERDLHMEVLMGINEWLQKLNPPKP